MVTERRAAGALGLAVREHVQRTSHPRLYLAWEIPKGGFFRGKSVDFKAKLYLREICQPYLLRHFQNESSPSQLGSD